MLDFQQLVELIKTTARHPVQVDEASSPKTVILHADDLLDCCRLLHANPQTYFDMLSCITGIDNGAEVNTMECVYNLYSIPFNHHMMLRVVLSREQPVIKSVTSIWKAADWQEREIFDMYGIQFADHPDMRRILMPADWDGHPLRKDYKQQDYYRGVKVEY